MSKIVRVRVRREKYPDRTHYEYPPEYDARKIQVLCYESTGDLTSVETRNDGYEYLIGIVKDIDLSRFLLSSDIEEIDYTTACEFGRVWRPQIEKIFDNNKVISIIGKFIRGEKLTQEEKRAINPDDLTPGINKSKIFDDLLIEYL